MRYRIIIIRPPNYAFSECFREVAETLMYGLRSLGHEADISFREILRGAQHIILGSHLLPPNADTVLPAGTVLYNLEQPDSPGTSAWLSLARKFPVWDYSRRNIEHWNSLDMKAVHVPIGYVLELSRIKPKEQDIDVLFYGSINDRRQKVIRALQDAGLRVEAHFGAFGEQRDYLIARAKVVLNVHFYESKIFEIVRVSYLLANHKAVVSEESVDDIPELRDGLEVVPYDKLVGMCCSVVREDERRAVLERAGFEAFSRIEEADILRKAMRA